MPIYAYKCGSCGHAKDVLQKVSDAPLTTCPACGAEAFSKQITAAGFQLKGSGWYATDFRNGGSSGATSSGTSSGEAKAADKPADGKSESGSSAKTDSPSASAGGCGSACACH